MRHTGLRSDWEGSLSGSGDRETEGEGMSPFQSRLPCVPKNRTETDQTGEVGRRECGIGAAKITRGQAADMVRSPRVGWIN